MFATRYVMGSTSLDHRPLISWPTQMPTGQAVQIRDAPLRVIVCSLVTLSSHGHQSGKQLCSDQVLKLNTELWQM